MDDAAFHRLEAQVSAITQPDPALLSYYMWTSIIGVVTLPALIPLYFRYHTLRYRFDGEGISMSYGILFHKEMHLTYARMQDIHLSQNILERWLGIGTVTVQTAGGGEGGDLQIVGVKHFEPIRDYLYARMRGIRPLGTEPAVRAGSEATSGSPDQLLAAIRDELKAAAAALARQSAR